MLLSPQAQSKGTPVPESTGIRLRCPGCFRMMGGLPHPETVVICSRCKLKFPYAREVWRALLPERQAHFSRFAQEYQQIRAAEGRGSAGDDYYLALPDRDLSGRNRYQWAIRARTFRYIERKILLGLSTLTRPTLRILDLGAGNGWMSYRLALRGHQPVAVDLIASGQDGLEAGEHFRKGLPVLFPRVQAELDNLPFADGQFDVAIFNASFHYSENYEKTMGEALRCTRKGGSVLIADTPWYANERSGLRMLEERRTLFVKRYGFPSNGLSSVEYLTDQRLARMENRLGIHWQVYEPYYGIRWLLRPWLAALRRKRTPSHFRIYAARANQ